MKSLLVLVWITVTLVCITSALNFEQHSSSALDAELEKGRQELVQIRNKAKTFTNPKFFRNLGLRQSKIKKLEARIKKLEELIQCPTCKMNRFEVIKKRIGNVSKRNKNTNVEQNKRITLLEKLKDTKTTPEVPIKNFEGSA